MGCPLLFRPRTASVRFRPPFLFRGSKHSGTKAEDVEAGARLMERVRSRDVAAFESLYDGYHRLVFGIALRMTSDATMAEDITQSIFLKIWTAPETFRDGNFPAWLSRVTRNRVLDVLRSRGNRPTEEIPVDLPAESAIEDVVFSRIDAQRITSVLGSLSDEQRVPIEMGFFAGVTHEEIARRTGIPLGTIKTRIRAGLRRMREALQEPVSR